MEKLQTIHLLRHSGNKPTGLGEHNWARVSCHATRDGHFTSAPQALNSAAEASISQNTHLRARWYFAEILRHNPPLILWHCYIIHLWCATLLTSTRCTHFLVCIHFSQWFPAFPRMPFNSPQRVGVNLLNSLKGRRAYKQLESVIIQLQGFTHLQLQLCPSNTSRRAAALRSGPSTPPLLLPLQRSFTLVLTLSTGVKELLSEEASALWMWGTDIETILHYWWLLMNQWLVQNQPKAILTFHSVIYQDKV